MTSFSNFKSTLISSSTTAAGIELGGGTSSYADVGDLPESPSQGDMALITSTNKLYVYNGSAWFNIAIVNQAPTAISGSETSYTLALDGTPTVVTLVSTDPEGLPLTWSATTSGDTQVGTVTNVDNVFTITPSTDELDVGTLSITFSVTDGNNTETAVSVFTLSFLSRLWPETALSIGTSSTNSLDNDTFIDRSTNAHAITPSGTPVQTAFHPYLDNWGVEFLANDMFTIPNHAGFDLSGSDDFTVESWIYRTGDNNQYAEWIVGKRATSSPYPFSWYTGIGAGNKFFIADNVGGNIAGTTAFELHKWYHVAAVRESGTVKVYVNGVLENTGSLTISEVNTPLMIGNYTVDTPEFNGFISNLRIVKGTAVYTSAFTPSTEKLTDISGTSLLTCQSNRFIDASSNEHIITISGSPEISAFNPFGQSEYAADENKGSVYLNGSSYMTLATSPFHMDTSDYTVECWIYPTVLGRYIMGIWSSTSASNQAWSFRTFSDGKINSEIDPGDVQIATSSAGIIKLNQWHHVALTRSGGDFRIFVDGDVVASGSRPGFNMNEGGGFMGIGAVQGLTGSPFTGYISDVYIRKGAAKYTSAFTIPTAPVQNTDATLYLPFDNAGIFDKTGNNSLTLNGNVVTSTTQTKYADTAMYFDGSGDYIVPKDYESLILGTSDFTIETWIYTNTLPSTGVYWVFIDNRAQSTAGDTNRFTIAFKGSTIVYFSKGADRITSSAISTNQWYHFALCRSGSTTKMFINGLQAGSNYTDTTNYNNTANRPIIGGDGDGVLSNFNGYFENFQILKGVAKYTTNFTPPTKTQGITYQAES